MHLNGRFEKPSDGAGLLNYQSLFNKGKFGMSTAV